MTLVRIFNPFQWNINQKINTKTSPDEWNDFTTKYQSPYLTSKLSTYFSRVSTLPKFINGWGSKRGTEWALHAKNVALYISVFGKRPTPKPHFRLRKLDKISCSVYEKLAIQLAEFPHSLRSCSKLIHTYLKSLIFLIRCTIYYFHNK